MKVYIIEEKWHSEECSWSEIVKVCKNKERAELLVLQYEEECEEYLRLIKKFDRETRVVIEASPFSVRIQLMKERSNLRNKIRYDWVKKGKYWYEGYPEHLFEISEYEIDELD